MPFCLIYFSKSVRLMDDSELIALLNESRSYNQKYDITGMLIYLKGRFLTNQEGRFMQVLEGNEQDVRELFATIKSDKRHRHVIELKESVIDEIYFKNWTMGFKSLQLEEYNRMPGFFELNDSFLNNEEFRRSNTALNFFRSFYNTNNQLDFL